MHLLQSFNDMISYVFKAKGVSGKGKGSPGEIRYWDSKKSPSNPMGAVFRLPDPPKVQGVPSPSEESLWTPVDQLKMGSTHHKDILQFKKAAADKLYKNIFKGKIDTATALKRFSEMLSVAGHIIPKLDNEVMTKNFKKLQKILKSAEGMEEFAAQMAIAGGVQKLSEMWDTMIAEHVLVPGEQPSSVPSEKPLPAEEKKPEPPKAEEKPKEYKKYAPEELSGVAGGMVMLRDAYHTGAVNAVQMKAVLDTTHENLKKNFSELLPKDYDMYAFVKDKLAVAGKWISMGEYGKAADRLSIVVNYLQDYHKDYKESVPYGYTVSPTALPNPQPNGYHLPQEGDPSGLPDGLGYRVGTVRQWSDGKYVKTRKGWLPLVAKVKEGKPEGGVEYKVGDKVKIVGDMQHKGEAGKVTEVLSTGTVKVSFSDGSYYYYNPESISPADSEGEEEEKPEAKDPDKVEPEELSPAILTDIANTQPMLPTGMGGVSLAEFVNNIGANAAKVTAANYGLAHHVHSLVIQANKNISDKHWTQAAIDLKKIATLIQDSKQNHMYSLPKGATIDADAVLEKTPLGYKVPAQDDPDALFGFGFKVGTVREWQDGHYIKTALGWLRLKMPGESGKEEEDKPAKKPKKISPPTPVEGEAFDPVKAWEEAKDNKKKELEAAGITIDPKNWLTFFQDIRKKRNDFKAKDNANEVTDSDVSASLSELSSLASTCSLLRDKLKSLGGDVASALMNDSTSYNNLAERLSAAKSSNDPAVIRKKIRSAYEKAEQVAEALNDSLNKAWFVPKPKMPSQPKKPVEPVKPDMSVRRGGVIFNDKGQILLVKPKGAYGGYKWSLPKGTMEAGETAEQAALREVFEETGLKCEVAGSVPGKFSGTTSSTAYYMMRLAAEGHGDPGEETESVKWVSPEEAVKHIEENPSTHRRDIEVLREASKHYQPPVTFPESFDDLEKVRGLGGTTHAILMKDKKTGKQFVVKRGKSEGHIEEEMAADAAYAALGVRVPRFKRFDTKEGPAKVSEHIEGVTLADYLSKNPGEKEAIHKKLQRGFVVDALLGNRDVVGLERDNVLIDKHGEPIRIDNGGSLRRRAQGGMKHELDGGKKNWDGYPMDLWDLRNSKKNARTAEVFGDIPFSDILEQIADATSPENVERLKKAVPKELHKDIDSRVNSLRDVHQVGTTFMGDAYTDKHADQVCKHVVGIGQHGITEMLPESLSADSPSDVYLKDSDGNHFGRLRTHGSERSVVTEFAEYVKAFGGNHDYVRQWNSSQGHGSWDSSAIAAKVFFSRRLPAKYYWKTGCKTASEQDSILKGFSGSNMEGMEESLTAYHALVYEFLRTTALPNTDRKRGVMRLFRTESLAALKSAKGPKGEKFTTNEDVNKTNKEISAEEKMELLMPHGSCESHSIMRPVVVNGMFYTEKIIPFSRVLGVYMFEGNPGSGHCSFLGDAENELVANAADIPFVVVGRQHDGMDHSDNQSLLMTGKYSK